MGIVVFDLDGTLIDSVADLHAALLALLAQEGRPAIALRDTREMIGGGARQLVQLAWEATGGSADPAILDRLYPRFIALYAEMLLERTRPYPGAIAALDALRHHTLAVCTNKPAASTVRILEGLGLRARFACVVGGDSLPVRKPDPAVLRWVIAACGGGPALLVGDSRTDFETARNAGIPCVGVRWGYPGPDPGGAAPSVWVERFEELPAVVEQLLLEESAGREGGPS
jgi:phosphoglycolate phosphatase